ncbi:ERBB receptor feedback inhibitor 1 [Gastrophryne carolinensis]
MTTAGLAAPDVSLKSGFLHSAQGLMCAKSCWANHSEYDNTFYGMEPYSIPYNVRPPTQQHISSLGPISRPVITNGHCCSENCMKAKKPNILHLGMPSVEHSTRCEDDQVVPLFKKLSMNGGSSSDRTPPLTPVKSGPPPFYAIPTSDRSSRPLPPLPISEDHFWDDADSEVEFFTSSETDLLLPEERPLAFKYGVPSRRSFRGCGQINYAYVGSTSAIKPAADERSTCQQNGCVQNSKPQKPEQCHRRLRRSHSGPAGSYNKPAIRVHTNRTSPNSDEDKPEVPPRIPIPPRPIKPDYRRWSAEVSSNTYSDEDRPPKIPPREPLSRSNSRTPSPKSLPSYLNGVMPPTQSFAPDPKYVSTKVFQRQNSEGSANKIPCILPIIENGKKASSTHYYLLPEKPSDTDRLDKYLTPEFKDAGSESKVSSWSSDSSSSSSSPKADTKAKLDFIHAKRKHLSDVVSP